MVGLSFVNRGSNIAQPAKINFLLQNLKWLKINYKYIKQPPEVVFQGCWYMFTRFLCHVTLCFQSKYFSGDISPLFDTFYLWKRAVSQWKTL